jgi:salicylate biosynthesis isochorismate synthase/menaquinone-specific isochorismate synthase
MPLLDPHPVERARVASAAPAEHFEAAVTRAVERIAAGELTKVVLAREVRVHAPGPIDPAPVYDGLRAGFPACFCYLVGTPELTFLGASPELLARREGQRVQTVALAGTRRRSADPAVDSHLGEQLMHSPKDREEQAIVTRRIMHALEPVSLWVRAADDPVLVKVMNVQHLGTPIRAQLTEPLSAVEVAALLHPTPAVGGEPSARALPLIPALEGLDRGWYAGPVGWTDPFEDGEFCVALRCALLRGDVAHLYAGEGIVADSDPAQELEANEAKLQALLPLLT